MCESHVSNPQTVGKCCSLLNSLPPSLLHPTPSLPRSPFLSDALSWRALFPPPSPCECVCVCACLPARPPGQHTGSERRTSASAALPGTAASCRQFLCQHTHTHERTRTHTFGKAASSAPRQEKKKAPSLPGRRGGCSFSLSLWMFISASRLSLPPQTQNLTSPRSACLPAPPLRIRSRGSTHSFSLTLAREPDSRFRM